MTRELSFYDNIMTGIFSPDLFRTVPFKIGLLMVGLISLFFVSENLQAQTCPAGSVQSTPTSRFTLNGDGTATDNNTGLMWMRCSLGLTWDGTTCTGTSTVHTWESAFAAAQGTSLASYTDWRIPNIKELSSIIELACDDPSINESVFPAEIGYLYWSSTPYMNEGSQVWIASFGSGSVVAFDKNYVSGRVRLVRVK